MISASARATCICIAATFLASLTLSAGAQQSPDVPSSAAPLPQRVRVSQRVMEHLIMKKVPPIYPAEAKKKHVQGDVVIQFVISKTGEVTQPRVISGDGLLVPAALDALKQWQYKPYLLNGQAVEVETQATIIFSLS